MGRIKLFESWTFKLPLPEPFAGEADKRGKKDTSDIGSLSLHNYMKKGRRATLHAPSLRAFIILADIVGGNKNGAVGYQKKGNAIERFFLETVRDEIDAREIRASVYEPDSGSWKSLRRTGNVVLNYPQLCERGSSGTDILALFAYASILSDSKLYDPEFANTFSDFIKERAVGSDTEKLMSLGFLLCDNLYRRLENAAALGSSGIPFDNSLIANGNVPLLQYVSLDKDDYRPTHSSFGTFEVFRIKRGTSKGTIKELKDKYARHLFLTETERALVPKLPETYEVPEEVTDILEAVCNTPMRVFMSAGESGTGKTTNARMIAQLLNLPYYFFTCGEGTDEMDLISSMIPNVGSRPKKPESGMPSFRDMMMDPASALKVASGIYDEGIDEETAFRKIQEAMYQKGIEAGQKAKDFCMVESSIVTGCRRPSVIEIQEPSVITRPGTLVKLNGLLDDGASITLTDGEVVRRNPDTVILLTTNMGYKGCRGFNESVLSRMRMILYSNPLTADDMVRRVKKKLPQGAVTDLMLNKMAKTVTEIQEYCRTEMIDGGVCGYREYEDWVWAFIIQHDVCRAAKRTVIAKASPDEESRDEIYKTQILTKFSEGQAA